MSMISLLLHKSKVKPRTSVNNKDIIQMYLGYNLLISQRTISINASFVVGITSSGMVSFGGVHLSTLLCTMNSWLL